MPRRQLERAAPLTRDEVGRQLHVSRETLGRLQTYLDLLQKWQRSINLVGPATLADPWRRHIMDSAQLWQLLPPDTRILADLGSGAGLPGLILAILGVPEVHLIESDRRKAAFLREAARACGVAVTVHADRIDAVPPFPADVITARALAPLPQLLGLAERFLRPGSICIFPKGRGAESDPKGRGAESELTLARESWTMTVTARPSLTEPDSQILIISEICRA